MFQSRYTIRDVHDAVNLWHRHVLILVHSRTENVVETGISCRQQYPPHLKAQEPLNVSLKSLKSLKSLFARSA